ncbi:dTDP-4-dehydrorhamnose 3,5-epimerase [Pigmentiphaga humi]|uniref:dTDP-4-dehydrorhamnose 3,5-epimerase n=1 Tax=Pigmentiphaga humi TaxID=2478468 RepID=A0A3P4B390_9BURK|nr:dTDP-4-dehydrorhamnose 3,5-epimerase [Pigmentiphaga humi]VCU70098.1 dTDP-4-dehydrorhamnose 3,5-epimerase [Pigmentiphaga humi]
MKIVATRLPGVLVFEPKVFGDERGFFVETFRQTWLQEAGIDQAFVQDNQSRSRRGVLRGLHYQLTNPQGKLVRAARGRVYDVAVDIRQGSPNFGQWVGVELDDVHHRQLWIPPGFAHGFCVLSEQAEFVYKCTSYYDAPSDSGVLWNDLDIGIQWPDVGVPFQLSAKDIAMPRLCDKAAETLPPYDSRP